MEAPEKIHHPDDVTKEKESSFTPENDSEAAPTFKVEGDVSGDVFGDEASAEVKYKTMAWWQAGMVMIAENISLGILSLPAVMSAIGLGPGLIVLLCLCLITTYSGYLYYIFKIKYPFINNVADVGGVIFGPWGQELVGLAYNIFNIFCMASHILTFMICFNVITEHGTCTLVWGVVAVIVFFLFLIPRTLKNVSYFSIASALSIGSAVVLTMIALGVSPKPNAHITGFAHPSFPAGMLETTNVVFAFACHNSFPSLISELKDPRDFPKSLALLQTVNTILYVIVAVVVYRYAGDMVSTPALGSTGFLVRKIAYGIALPTIIIAGVIFGHLSCKSFYLRIFKGTPYLHSRGFVATASWLGIDAAICVVSFIIAASIPNFSNLLGFVSSLFASLFSYALGGIMWLHVYRGDYFAGPKRIAAFAAAVGLILIGAAICGLGLYASGKALHDGSSGASWSCADNSQS
ncbi:transmembrane amino acid transporter protein-domain-containing protein [Phyllosticta citrichinensis]|uniref:Transmembrane amino acid transporter protein-domain-containing protein n=1 Tax=Phyllosticta citrichinensis TaxID=1130410 RepID=A0ABR1XG18_9PEZI